MKDPNFSGYHAKSPDGRVGPRTLLRKIKQRLVYGTLLLPYGVAKHQRLLEKCERLNNHTYTCFLRAPAQLRALSGAVLDFLGNPQNEGRRLELLMFACSNGAEVYTVASWLMTNVPDLDFHITASDLHQEMVDRCLAADYSAAEALQSEYITSEFIDATFERRGERYIVRESIRKRTTFTQASLLHGEGLAQKFAPADIVTAQNVLFHLKPDDARVAFRNIVRFLKPRSALFVEGMDANLRLELTQAHSLRPLTSDLRRIYSETRVHTPADWWNYYWGTEPYVPWRRDRARRYATIFLRES